MYSTYYIYVHQATSNTVYLLYFVKKYLIRFYSNMIFVHSVGDLSGSTQDDRQISYKRSQFGQTGIGSTAAKFKQDVSIWFLFYLIQWPLSHTSLHVYCTVWTFFYLVTVYCTTLMWISHIFKLSLQLRTLYKALLSEQSPTFSGRKKTQSYTHFVVKTFTGHTCPACDDDRALPYMFLSYTIFVSHKISLYLVTTYACNKL